MVRVLLIIAIIVVSITSLPMIKTTAMHLTSNDAATVEVEQQTVSKSHVEMDSYTSEQYVGEIYFPSLDVSDSIYYGNWDNNLETALEYGVAIDPMSGLPGDNKTLVLADHNNETFECLFSLNVGDTVEITIEDNLYVYEIYNIEVLDVDEAEEIFYNKDELVLYTCMKYGATTSLDKRLVIYGELI